MSKHPPHVVCSLCSCRLDWEDIGEDEFLCEVCGHSLHDDHVAVGVLRPAPAPALQKII